MTIDWTQPIETDESAAFGARLLADDCGGLFPIAILVGQRVFQYPRDGKPGPEAPPLRNVAPKPVRHEGWVAVVPSPPNVDYDFVASGPILADRDRLVKAHPTLKIAKIVWNSDGSPVEDDPVRSGVCETCVEKAVKSADEWRSKAAALQAELKTFYCDCGQSLLTGHHEDGCPHDKPVPDWRQSEMERMRHVVDAAVDSVDNFNHRGLLRLIDTVRAYQTQPCPTCEGGMIYLKRTQCPDCNGTDKKETTNDHT